MFPQVTQTLLVLAGFTSVFMAQNAHGQRAGSQGPTLTSSNTRDLALPQAPAPVLQSGTRPKIMLVGYWPPSNEALRPFSNNPTQNPQGWVGSDWEGRGYDVYAYFPEFNPPNCNNCGQGSGDFEVDYQDTSNDFWTIANALEPVAILTFSRGFIDSSWELEMNQFNRSFWFGDFTPPTQPTPAPPDASVPSGHLRNSSLPVGRIVEAVNQANLGLTPFVCYTQDGGGYLSEFLAYHGTWYKELHDAPNDPARCVAAGHIHVGGQISWPVAAQAAQITLREVIGKVDCVLAGNLCETFCDPMNPNTSGLPTVLSGAFGSGSGSDLHLHAEQGPALQFGYFLVGNQAQQPGTPLSLGRLCLSTTSGNFIGRYNIAGTPANSIGRFDMFGMFQNLSGTSTGPTGFDVPSMIPNLGAPIMAGETWHFQMWHRETNGASNFSNGLSVLF